MTEGRDYAVATTDRAHERAAVVLAELVSVASAHRGDAFDACEFVMDYLKTEAPFWKKEVSEQGEKWVESRSSDDEARARWED